MSDMGKCVVWNRLHNSAVVGASERGANGSRTGGAFAASKFGSGYSVNGNSQFIDFNGGLDRTKGAATFFYTPNYGSTTAGNYAIFSYVTQGYHVVRSIQLFRFLMIGGTGTNYVDINLTFSAGDRLFFHVAWDSSNLWGTGNKTYIFVRNENTGGTVSGYGDNVAAVHANYANVRICNRGNNDNQCNGIIDNLKTYNDNIQDYSNDMNNEKFGGAKRRQQ